MRAVSFGQSALTRRGTLQEMSFNTWYLHKAKQCDRLASTADDAMRTIYKDEAKLWRQIARDEAKLYGAGPALTAGLVLQRWRVIG